MKNTLKILAILLLLIGCQKEDSVVESKVIVIQNVISFYYGRAFHDDIHITLREIPGQQKYTLQVEIIHGDGIKEDGTADFTKETREISQKEFERFDKLVSEDSLLQRSMIEPIGGADGSSWQITRIKAGVQITHWRWCPIDRKDREFVELGEEFMRFAGVEIPSGDEYF